MTINHFKQFRRIGMLWLCLVVLTAVIPWLASASGTFTFGHWDIHGVMVLLMVLSLACIPAALIAWRLPAYWSNCRASLLVWGAWCFCVLGACLFLIRAPLTSPAIGYHSRLPSASNLGSGLYRQTRVELSSSTALHGRHGAAIWGHRILWESTLGKPDDVYSCRFAASRCRHWRCRTGEVRWIAGLLYYRHTELPNISSAADRAYFNCHLATSHSPAH